MPIGPIRPMRLMDFNLYLITDRVNLPRKRNLLTAVRQALKAGAGAIQLREKDLEAGELLKMAHKMRKLTDEYSAGLFINDRFDIALAAGADGVHLTQNSIPVDVVRDTVKKKLLIGVSTHSLKEARQAEKGGADFITLGPVYKTASKLKYGAPVGIDKFKTITGKIHIPVFALGGIKTENLREVKDAGAYGVSMISEIFRADNIQKKTVEIDQIIKTDFEPFREKK